MLYLIWNGALEIVADRHTLGVFSRKLWCRLLEELPQFRELRMDHLRFQPEGRRRISLTLWGVEDLQRSIASTLPAVLSVNRHREVLTGRCVSLFWAC